jgi:hypothetical protein
LIGLVPLGFAHITYIREIHRLRKSVLMALSRSSQTNSFQTSSSVVQFNPARLIGRKKRTTASRGRIVKDFSSVPELEQNTALRQIQDSDC